jgi:hypothetical protein
VLQTAVGRRFTLIHSQDCDAKFPLDVDDEQLDEEAPEAVQRETIMTHLLVRMKLGKLTEQIVRFFHLLLIAPRLTLLRLADSGGLRVRFFLHPLIAHVLTLCFLCRIRPPSYARILDFDRQIRVLEAEVPAFYAIDESAPRLLFHKSIALKVSCSISLLPFCR